MNLKQGIASTLKSYRLPWWQVVLLSVGVSLLGRLSGGKTKKAEQKLYTIKLEQAPWAPPAWLFGVAWPVNNIFVLQALQHLLQLEDIPEKKKLLILQAAIWTVFFSFSYVYFRKKSPVLAAVWTVADAALSISSFVLARKVDKKLAYYYIPLSVWTGYASTVATYQALMNADPVLKTAAPVHSGLLL